MKKQQIKKILIIDLIIIFIFMLFIATGLFIYSQKILNPDYYEMKEKYEEYKFKIAVRDAKYEAYKDLIDSELGLVAYWDFSNPELTKGNITYDLHNGYKGIMHGVTYDPEEEAFYFDGDDYIVVEDFPALTESITIIAEVKPELTGQNQRIISRQYGKGTQTGYSSYQLGIGSNNLFRWSIGGIFDYYIEQLKPEENSWYNIKSIYKAEKIEVYINNQNYISEITNLNEIKHNITQPLSIGGSIIIIINQQNDFRNGYKGFIKSIIIYE